jgi:hypothetical protein
MVGDRIGIKTTIDFDQGLLDADAQPPASTGCPLDSHQKNGVKLSGGNQEI